MEESLTKKEKRELAKQKKQEERSKEKLTDRFKTIGYVALVVGILVGGIWYLGSSSPTPSESLNDKFVDYAGEIGLDQGTFETDLSSGSFDSKINADIASGNASGVNSTPSFFLNGEKIPNPSSYEEFRSLISGAISGGAGEDKTEILENDWVKGSENATVTLVEYSDFQCPACATYYPIVKQLEAEFSDDLRFVYRHFPLTQIHTNAYAAAQAAEAAGSQGKFWEMHDKLFEDQRVWSSL